MIKINIILSNITWKKYLKNPHIFLKKKVDLLNKKEKLFKKNTFICSILLSGPNEIKSLNKKFRKKNKPTDVLSFPFYNKHQLSYEVKKEKEVYLGDIIINLNKVRSKNNKIKFLKELNKLWIHGLVHLFGYQHENDQDFYKMSNLEKKYLKYID
jgi:probable rRNA maturation factor